VRARVEAPALLHYARAGLFSPLFSFGLILRAPHTPSPPRFCRAPKSPPLAFAAKTFFPHTHTRKTNTHTATSQCIHHPRKNKHTHKHTYPKLTRAPKTCPHAQKGRWKKSTSHDTRKHTHAPHSLFSTHAQQQQAAAQQQAGPRRPFVLSSQFPMYIYLSLAPFINTEAPFCHAFFSHNTTYTTRQQRGVFPSDVVCGCAGPHCPNPFLAHHTPTAMDAGEVNEEKGGRYPSTCV
jgi:hypothetical protein